MVTDLTYQLCMMALDDVLCVLYHEYRCFISNNTCIKIQQTKYLIRHNVEKKKHLMIFIMNRLPLWKFIWQWIFSLLRRLFPPLIPKTNFDRAWQLVTCQVSYNKQELLHKYLGLEGSLLLVFLAFCVVFYVFFSCFWVISVSLYCPFLIGSSVFDLWLMSIIIFIIM